MLALNKISFGNRRARAYFKGTEKLKFSFLVGGRPNSSKGLDSKKCRIDLHKTSTELRRSPQDRKMKILNLIESCNH